MYSNLQQRVFNKIATDKQINLVILDKRKLKIAFSTSLKTEKETPPKLWDLGDFFIEAISF